MTGDPADISPDIALDLPARLRAVPAIDPEAPALQFEGRWYTWGYLERVRAALDELLNEAGIGAGGAIGIVLRNRPPQAGAALAVLSGARCLVTMSSLQPDARLVADVEAQGLPVVMAETQEWQRAGLLDAVAHLGAMGVDLTGDDAEPVRLRHLPDPRRRASLRSAQPDVAVEMLTSGTTGPPKRVRLTWRNLESALHATVRPPARDFEVRLRSGVALLTMPLMHISGLWVLIQNAWQGRRISMLERFDVVAWTQAVLEHRPALVSLPPTALRMVVDAEVPAEVFESVRGCLAGTAALDPVLQETFETRYGVPVLPVYGATEFTGAVTGWTLADHREFAERKRGSVGRAFPGFDLQVVDDQGRTVGPDEDGVLEVRGPQVGGANEGEWVRTSDRVRLDADGFLWVLGRADDVIIRGGFKIVPGEVVRALESHSAVREAAVVGLPDRRLGQVPVAAVVADGHPLHETEVLAHVRAMLEPFKVPVRIVTVDALPRTPSLKVDQPALRALLEAGQVPV